MEHTSSSQRPNWLLLFAIAIAIFSVALNVTTFYNLVPLLMKQFSFGTIFAQWLINSYLLAIVTFVILCSRLSDFINKKKFFLIGCIIFALGSLAIAADHDAFFLLIGRLLQGFSVAIIFPGSISLIKENFHPSKQVTAFGIWSAASGLGFALGPLISGFTAILDWRLVFLLNVFIILITFLITLWKAPSIKTMRQFQSFDWLGFVFLFIGLFSVVLALINSTHWGWGWHSPKALVIFSLGVFFLLIFVFVEKRKKNPLIDFNILKNSTFTYCLLGLIVYAYSMNLLLFLFNLLVQDPFFTHFDPKQAGLAVLPLCFGYFISSIFAGHLVNFFKKDIILFSITFLLMLSSFFMFSFTHALTGYTYFLVPLILAGFSFGICQTLFSRMALASLPEDEVNEAAGMIVMSIYFGAILAISLGGLIYHLSYEFGFLQMLSHLGVHGSLQQVLLNESHVPQKQLLITINSMTYHQKIPFIAAITRGTTYGFDMAMFISGIVSTLMLLITFFVFTRRSAIPTEKREE